MSSHTGAMVALFLPAQAAAELYEVCKDEFIWSSCEWTPQEDLHLTLAYLGDTAVGTIDNQTKEVVLETVQEYSKKVGIISGKLSSQTGRFDNADQNVCYAGVNSPDLADFRQGLVDALAATGVTVATNYEFTPHVTLAYATDDQSVPSFKLPDLPIAFDTITVAWGDERFPILLQHEETMPNQTQTQDQEIIIEKSAGAAGSDGKTILRAYGKTQNSIDGVDVENRRITFCAYPYLLDRHGTTIRPSAWLLDNYKKNPISSFAHNNYDELPVAKAVDVWVEQVGNSNGRQAGLWCILEFAKHPFAEDLFQCYVGGFMNAVSVEAEALDYELPGRDFDGQTGPTYTKVELDDISCVPVPGNQGALAQRSATGAQHELIERAWYRVWEKVQRAGREMSAKNMTALQDIHDELAGMEERCQVLRGKLKSFLDEKQPAAAAVQEAAPETDETIKRDAVTNQSEEHQPSDQADTNPTREAEVNTNQEIAATTTTDQTQPGASDNNYINNWLTKLGWKS